MKSKVVKSAFILTTGVLISKAIGVFYRLPLSNILGAEGVGMYQLVFSVYALIVTIIGSGLPIAISRLTAEAISKNKPTKAVFIPSMCVGLLIGLIFSIVVYFLANYIANSQGNSLISVGYKVISPAIFFVSGLSVLKGYFQGTVNMVPTSISYILEQIIKLIVGLLLAYYLSKQSIVKAVTGSLIGVTLSELVAFLVLLIIYLFKREKASKVKVNYRLSTIELIKIALPITIGSVLIPLSQFFDSFMVVNLLSVTMLKNDATAMYGLYSGSVNPIVNMPIMLVLSLAMIIIPVVSKDRIACNYEGILSKSNLSIKVCFLVGLPCSILLSVFSKGLLNLVYPRFTDYQIEVASSLLKIASFSIVFYGTMQIETSLMQGLDKIYLPIRNLLFALAIKELLVVLLVKGYGIQGLSVATLLMSIIACLLNSISYHKLLGRRFNLSKTVVSVLIINYIFFALTISIKYFIFSDIVGFLVASIVGGSIYYILIKNNEVLTNFELKSMGLNLKDKVSLRNKFLRNNYDYSNRCW